MNKQFLRFSIFTAFFIILIVTLVVRLQTYFHPGFFLAVFMSKHITLLTIEMQLVFKWKTIFKLCLWGCSIYDAVMVTRKVLSCGRQKAAKGSVSVLGKLLSRRIKLLSVVKAEIALLKHTDRNSPLSCSPLHWKVSSLPQLPTESVIIF